MIRIFLPFLIVAAFPATMLIFVGILITGDSPDVIWFALGALAGAMGHMVYDVLIKNVRP